MSASKKIVIGIAAALITMALFSAFRYTNTPEFDSNGVVWNGKQEIVTQTEIDHVSIPCFDTLHFTAGSTNQKVNFYNPDNNSCYMNMTIELDETEIWSIDNIAPGYGVYSLDLNEPLDSGVYNNCRFIVRCFDMESNAEMNGANVVFDLYVD